MFAMGLTRSSKLGNPAPRMRRSSGLDKSGDGTGSTGGHDAASILIGSVLWSLACIGDPHRRHPYQFTVRLFAPDIVIRGLALYRIGVEPGELDVGRAGFGGIGLN